MSPSVRPLVSQTVPMGGCLTTVQAPVRLSARTSGHTLSAYPDLAPLGALALPDRSEHLRLHMWEN